MMLKLISSNYCCHLSTNLKTVCHYSDTEIYLLSSPRLNFDAKRLLMSSSSVLELAATDQSCHRSYGNICLNRISTLNLHLITSIVCLFTNNATRLMKSWLVSILFSIPFRNMSKQDQFSYICTATVFKVLFYILCDSKYSMIETSVPVRQC